uniref:Prostacyclin synthase n=1 Tax=Pyxicephalus adspersus TaxID=30357 RepID=A0AAV3ATJ8_PYXAD|nr:TPA: hypothetical protein GDO54_007930 [Pyxicephalus adspersus]
MRECIVFCALCLMYGVPVLGSDRRHKEPPLDCGFIPWLGHALEFGRDAAAFLSRMKAKHGDIFTVQVAGRFVTVLLDPLSYDHVVWESSDKLDFGKYAKILMERMFDVTLPDHDAIAEKALLRSHLQNQNLPVLARSMFRNLSAILNDNSVAVTTWREDGLFSFSYGVMLRAGYLTLFGSESEKLWAAGRDVRHSLHVYTQFQKFDQLLMKSARGVLSADGVLEESLRLTAAPFITREVLTELPLKLEDGTEYLLRRGDRLCLFPYISPQMDPEIHPEPQVFVWLLILNFEFELVNPAEKIPEFDRSRYGFGVLQPEGDIKFRYKRRSL